MSTETISTTTTEYSCEACGQGFDRDNAEPIQVGGWYGNVNFAWGRYAGVHTCKSVAVRCPHCGTVRRLPYPFDA